jgi:hypothetical protein
MNAASACLSTVAVDSDCQRSPWHDAHPPGTTDAAAERMYVLDGGEATVEDISQWSPGVNEGQPRSFSDNVYLIRHGQGLDDLGRWLG